VSSIDFSFPRYVAARKGEAASRLREGAAYAYGGDLKVRRTFDKVRPVTLAMESAVRFWQTVGRNRLLGNAVRVGDRQFPRIHALCRRAAETLQIDLPQIYVTGDVSVLGAHTFGTSEEATIVLHGVLIDHLSDDELLMVIGHECGHIQNNHTVYQTALYFLANAANQFVRWGTRPAVLALNAWARRAEITCDRAGLLCTKDLGPATTALVKLAVGSRRLYSDIDVDEYLRQLDETARGPGRFDELWEQHPYLPKRVQALRLFAQTTYFRSTAGTYVAGEPGLTKEDCDAQVAELLSVVG
jgi:Zn-dependent protease with chaperone function